jgi:hypothetical protein
MTMNLFAHHDRLLREGFRTWTSAGHSSEHDASMPGCLVTDLIMPEMTAWSCNAGC